MNPKGFSFRLSVLLGCTGVIEASSNLQDWIPIGTNVADVADVLFTDAAAGNFPMRFYRVPLEP
jgi:hypothetical protein